MVALGGHTTVMASMAAFPHDVALQARCKSQRAPKCTLHSCKSSGKGIRCGRQQRVRCGILSNGSHQNRLQGPKVTKNSRPNNPQPFVLLQCSAGRSQPKACSAKRPFFLSHAKVHSIACTIIYCSCKAAKNYCTKH
eukprot:3252169-Amphidinium_carterae.1